MRCTNGTQRFFDYANERHNIWARRYLLKLPREEWTSDPVLSVYPFTNVYRELDAVTIWQRKYVRYPMRNRSLPEITLAVAMHRMFNRISTGEAIFLQRDMEYGETPFETLLRYATGPLSIPIRIMHRAIKTYCGNGPYVTGSYTVSSPPGKNKLQGVLHTVQQFVRSGAWKWRECTADDFVTPPTTMHQAWDVLRAQPYVGPFHAYEMVCDLRYTPVLENATDKMTWCNVGPGAKRGLNRVMDQPIKARISNETWREETRRLLSESMTMFRPRDADTWPAWEMREVEHTLCEFDKYERVLEGSGRPRGRYREGRPK